MMEKWLPILFEISTYSILIPLLTGVVRWRKLIPEQKILCLFIIIASVIQLVASFLASHQINNLPLLHLFTVVEFGALCWIFHLGLPRWFDQRKAVLLISLFTVFALVNVLFWQDLTAYNSYSRGLSAFFMVLLALYYFVTVLRELQVTNLAESFMFWFCTGVLLYFSANLLLFLYSSMIAQMDVDTNYQIWGIHAVLNILLYLFYTIALWSKPEQRISAKFS